MSTAALVSVPEYLSKTFEPDCDYVDGALVERNGGTKDHSTLQFRVALWFHERAQELEVSAFVELRVRVNERRFRIPDVCVMAHPVPEEQVVTVPPYVCIEILSPEDNFRTMQDRFDDYLTMGAANVWLLDPASRRGWSITRAGHTEALDGMMRSTDGRVTLPIADLYHQ
jgi:Uma2 family endonuclease